MTVCRPILLLALSVFVAGCATSPEQQAKRDGDRCTARGFQSKTKAYDDCVSQIEGTRDARMHTRHRELVERPSPTPFSR